MRLVILAAMVIAMPASAAPPPPGAAQAPASRPVEPVRIELPQCRIRFNVVPADLPAPPPVRRLGELPPGDTVLAVYREVEGCPEPVIVRYGDGRPARDERSATPAPAVEPSER